MQPVASELTKDFSPSFDIQSVNVAKGSVASEIGAPWRRHYLLLVAGEAIVEISGQKAEHARLKEGDEALELNDHRVLSVESIVGSTLIVLSGA